MASYRIGIGSFNLKDGAVGIGTESTGLGNLKVEGTIKTTDLDVGISTFTRYSGFEAEQTNIVRDASYGDNEPVTYSVTVKSVSGSNVYFLDGVQTPVLTLKRGVTYTFDQSADTNSNHPLRFKDGDGNSYSTGVTATGTAGSLGAKVTLVVASDAPDDLRYYCTSHGNGMGNIISVINRDPSNLETTGDIVIDTGKTLTVGLGATISVGSLGSLDVKHHFSVPSGDTSQRNESSGYQEGVVRYNVDLGTMEFFNGNEWRQFTVNGASGRALIAGGENDPSGTDFKIIEYIQTSTLGNSTDFGELTNTNMQNPASLSNSIRALFGGGQPTTATIDYVAIASRGNGIDFGDLSSGRPRGSGLASSTRGIFVGGNPGVNIMDYVEIMTLGDALDFGDLSFSGQGPSATASPTRGIITNDYSSNLDIDTITIASKGNGITFGKDLFYGGYGGNNGASTGTRGVWMGGYTSNSPQSPQAKRRTTSIRGVEFSSGGNAVEYGNLMSADYSVYGSSTGTTTRGFYFGGFAPDGSIDAVNVIQFMNIQSSGDAQNFGDLTVPRSSIGSVCDSHGGLGGY